MKNYFVCSDIHGFYDEWMNSLSEIGFDKDNPNHILVVLGDIFDRGSQPLDIYRFLKNLPKERRILIRGNHEQLLKELVKRRYAEQHDYHNKTIDTLFQLAGYIDYDDFVSQMYKELSLKHALYGTSEYQDIKLKWSHKKDAVFDNDIIREILDWIDSNEWQDYFETNHYIFVHSFIPTRKFVDFEKTMEKGYFIYYKEDEFREDWRNATSTEWDDAKWCCPWVMEKNGLNKTGKTIICGHWHTSDFFNNLLYPNDKSKWLNVKFSNPIFKSEKYPGLVGLDTCTALTKKVNVLILDEEEL